MSNLLGRDAEDNQCAHQGCSMLLLNDDQEKALSLR